MNKRDFDLNMSFTYQFFVQSCVLRIYLLYFTFSLHQIVWHVFRVVTALLCWLMQATDSVVETQDNDLQVKVQFLHGHFIYSYQVLFFFLRVSFGPVTILNRTCQASIS